MYLGEKKIGHVYLSDTGYIYYLEIKKQYRNQGYGTLLLNEAISKGGYWLHIEKPNVGAKKLYTKLGFIAVWTVDYLHLYVKENKLSDYHNLRNLGSMKKMLGNLNNVYKEIREYNYDQNKKTAFDDRGYQIL